ncbi:MAG TPA: ABC transporter permease [Anaerolineae bacterium]|nr:ABC transporter permease [Anaerolineae bacterium]
MIPSKVLAFLRKDLKLEMSYRFSFLMHFLSIFLSVAIFFFISKLIGSSVSAHLKDYGGNYFSFALVGIAFSNFLGTGLSSFSSIISSAQSEGTVEAMLVTPTKVSSIIVMASIWDFLMTTFDVLVYLALGALLFGLNLSQSNIPAAALIIFLTILASSGLGIISASFIMVLKRGDPVNWLFGSFSSFIGGTYFPVTVLPDWLQKVSYLFPMFYALRAMRHAVLQGFSFTALLPDMGALALFSIIILPISIIMFKWAVKLAKTDGSLVTY